MDGEGRGSLTEFKPRSPESSDSHSGKAEVRTRQFMRGSSARIKFGNVQKNVDSKKAGDKTEIQVSGSRTGNEIIFGLN